MVEITTSFLCYFKHSIFIIISTKPNTCNTNIWFSFRSSNIPNSIWVFNSSICLSIRKKDYSFSSLCWWSQEYLLSLLKSIRNVCLSHCIYSTQYVSDLFLAVWWCKWKTYRNLWIKFNNSNFISTVQLVNKNFYCFNCTWQFIIIFHGTRLVQDEDIWYWAVLLWYLRSYNSY